MAIKVTTNTTEISQDDAFFINPWGKVYIEGNKIKKGDGLEISPFYFSFHFYWHPEIIVPKIYPREEIEEERGGYQYLEEK